MKQQAKIPKLRFPQYKEDWAFLSLGSISKEIKRVLSNKEDVSDLEVLTISSENGWMSQKERFSQVIAGQSLEKYTILQKGEMAYNRGASKRFKYGCFYALKTYEKALVPNVYISFVFNEDCDSDFYNHLFSTGYANKQLRRFISSSVRLDGLLNINRDNFFSIKIPHPSLSEQKRIATFLTVLDNKIAELKQKKNLLEQYKKGVMQKLFSQELRFKDDNGKEFPKWEKLRLGDNATSFSGGTPLTTKKVYYYGEIPFIKSGEINDAKTEQYISEEGLKNSSAKMVEVGDLLYALYGATSGEAGISKIRGAINQAVLCIRSDRYDKIFLLNFLQLTKQLIVGTYLQGGQGNLSADIVKGLLIPTPCAQEQKKIAEFLIAIDNKIISATTQIQQTQQYKKGLLQKMFC